MSDEQPAVIVKDLYKTFRLPFEQSSGIKQSVVNFFTRKKGYETQRVLSDVSFEIKKGEFFGIVGRNGSGKSTLLKLLANIYVPDKGLVQVNGTLTPFIELGVGFNFELTGRENVFLNGALLGFSRSEMEKMYDDIVSFAELEKFMDQKLKNYSSGMQVRLAFSIAIRADSDILLIDEVLAVGDSAFQQKCFDYFKRLKDQKKTIILVTHDMGSVKRFCDRALIISKGKLEEIGEPDEIANQYMYENLRDSGNEKVEDKTLTAKLDHLKVKVKSPTRLKNTDTLKFDVEYKLAQDLDVFIGLSVLYQGVGIIEDSTRNLKIPSKGNKLHRVSYELPVDKFNTATFTVRLALFDSKTDEPIGYVTEACSFLVESKPDKSKGGPILSSGSWELNETN